MVLIPQLSQCYRASEALPVVHIMSFHFNVECFTRILFRLILLGDLSRVCDALCADVGSIVPFTSELSIVSGKLCMPDVLTY